MTKQNTPQLKFPVKGVEKKGESYLNLVFYEDQKLSLVISNFSIKFQECV